MKDKLLILGLFTTIIFSSCKQIPKPKEILKKSFDKCQTIENGYYEMEHYIKYMSNNDTSLQVYKCYFKRLEEDTIYSSAFHYQMFSENEYNRDVLYSGEDFILFSKKDSTGEIMSKKLWASKIKSYSHNYTFYSPLFNKKSYLLSQDTTFLNKNNNFEYMGEETINNNACYHIKKSIIPENDSTEMMKTLRMEIDYWINKQDYIPVQYSIAMDLTMNNDTMCQFEKNTLIKYKLNNLKDESELKPSSIPSFVNLKDYKPYKALEILPNDIIAPNWALVSLEDKTVKLSDLKGKLVLIDFFYKACYPCMLALPTLQDLHERYNSKGLVVIGIDPYDTKEKDDIDNFLAKRGVSYTILLGGKDVSKEYHVTGYPTMYLIDKNGKIILSQVGYGEDVEEKLEKIIKENL